MFISTDFKKKYKEKAIGQSKALDACTIVKEAQTPLGCLYYNANVNAVYICDYKFNPALKERVRSVMPEKTSVSQDVKNTIVELLIHAKIVTLNKKGRPEQRHGLSNPPVFEWREYLSAFNGVSLKTKTGKEKVRRVLSTESQCLEAFQQYKRAPEKYRASRKRKAMIVVAWFEGRFDALAVPHDLKTVAKEVSR
eukprot:g8630.t1